MTIEPSLHHGGDALTLATRELELTVTTSVGPRVVSFRARRGRNLFFEFPEDQPRAHGFHFRGGHRLWHAPEDIVRTYQPDDDPLEVRRLPKGVALTQPVEPQTGLQKGMAIELLGERTVRVTHTLTNHGLWPVECAPWAITMLRGRGAYGVLPLLPKGSHARGDLLPTYTLIPWSYTDFALPLWRFRRDFIGMDVNRAKEAQKLGLSAYPGWAACWLGGDVFVKYAPPLPGAAYPDFGSAFETFTNGEMLEFETLGRLGAIAPGKSVRHVEHWTVLTRQPKPSTEAAYRRKLLPAVTAWLKTLR